MICRIPLAPMLETLVPVLTPHRALRLERLATESSLDDGVAPRLEAAFARGSGHGLLQLAPPRREAVCRLSSPSGAPSRCASSQPSAPPASPPQAARRASKSPRRPNIIALADEAPPMRGGEYLDAECLFSLWRALKGALDEELSESGLSIQNFLSEPGQPLAPCRARPFQPRRKPQGFRPSLRLHGDLRLDCSAPRAACAISGSATRSREYAGAGAKTELLPGSSTGQPRKRKLRVAERGRRLGRNLPSSAVDAAGGDAAPLRRRDLGARRPRRPHAGPVAQQPAEPSVGRGDGRRRSSPRSSARNRFSTSRSRSRSTARP